MVPWNNFWRHAGNAILASFLLAHPGPVSAQQQPAATPSPPQTQQAAPEPLSEDELEVLVARIALYPDELVALVTSASLYPLQVVEAGRYLENVKKDKNLKPKDSWDGSVISLLNYPQIVKMMSDDLEWTQQLGDALANQQKDVLVAIQQLRDKAVADGIIKTDDKIKVTEENDNIVIQPVSTDTVYVPRYEPQMLYDPGYPPEPISYYSDPYPSYWYPTAPYWAAAITGGIWAATVDWDDWGVWGGGWNDDVDIDCNNCFNDRDFNGKFNNFKDVDWKNVDRSKIKFDKNQFANIDRTKIRNDIKANDRNSLKNKSADIRNNRGAAAGNRPGKVDVKDVRASKIEKDRRQAAGGKAADARQGGKKPGQGAVAKASGQGGNRDVRKSGNIDRAAGKPRPAAKADNRPKKPSALGTPGNGKKAKMQSQRGAKSMGGGQPRRPQASAHRGGGQQVHRGGHRTVRHAGGGGHRGGGGGRGGGGRR